VTELVDITAIRSRLEGSTTARVFPEWATDRADLSRALDALERAQAASEGVDMLVAQAERRGAVKALQSASRKGRMSGDLFPRHCHWLDERADAIENGAAL
jgi:hypothetical protein